MRRKSVWKQRAIAYLAAVSLAVGMIPASLPAADAYAEETDVAETAVLEADVQQTDEQEPASTQEADEQETDVKEAEQEADEEEAQPETEESDDFMLTPEQEGEGVWYDYAGMDPETIQTHEEETIDGETHPKLWKYNQSPYIQDFDTVIYDINAGNMPTALFATFDTAEGVSYQFSFDYIVRLMRTNGWELIPFPDATNTFDVYVHDGAVTPENRISNINGDSTEADIEAKKLELNKQLEALKNSNSQKMGTFLGNDKNWTKDVFSFTARSNKTTIIFRSYRADYCAALVTKMTLTPSDDPLNNVNTAKSNNNLVQNGVCANDQPGWKAHHGKGEVSFTENGNDATTGIELNKGESEGVSQYLTDLLQKGDAISYAFDITGMSDISENSDTVEVYLEGGDLTQPVKLTTAKVKNGEWQTVSGTYYIESETPQVYKIVLKAKSNGDQGAVIDNVSVTLSKQADGSEHNDLSKLKAQAIAIVEEQQDTLTDEDRNIYKDKIIHAPDEDTILNLLKDAAKKAIQNKGDDAADQVDKGDYNLKDELKGEIGKVVESTVDGIDPADTVQKIGEVLENGKQEIDDILDDGINANKKAASDAIDGMENLTDDQKKEHKDKIENAQDPQDIINELKEAARKELEAKAAKAKEEIDGLPDITSGNKDKEDYKDDVDDAKNDARAEVNKSDTVDEILKELSKGKDEIDKAADEAKKAAGVQTSLDKDKDDAKDSVDNMKELEDKDKNDAKDKINNAEDKEAVREALKEAAQKEIDNAADKAKKETDALPNLTPDEKNKVKADIDQAAEDAKDNIKKSDTVKEIKDATDKGVKDINDLVVNAAKKDGKDTIDKMDNLSKEEKDKYKDELDKADTEDKVNQVIKDASKKDVDNYAKDAKDKIDKSDFLTDAEKNDLKKKVDAAADDAKKKIDAAKNPAEIKKAADDGKTAINLIVNWTVNLTKEEMNIWKNSQSLESVENSILNTNTDKKENKGSNFSKLRLKGIGQKKAIKLKWKKQSGADGYIIYGAPCGKKMKKLKTINNGKTTTWTQKKCKKGTYYKYKVVAYKTIAGQKRVIAQSIGVHSITNGGKYLNPTKVILKSKKKITVKKGKTVKIKATYNNKKKVKNHISVLRFESSNTAVATVGYKTGKVKAKKPGTCTIFVYLQNGYYKTVKVTVKK